MDYEHNRLAPHVKGTTWDGMYCEIKDDAGLPMNLTGFTAVSRFRQGANSAIVLEFSTTDGTLTIPNPLNGKIYYSERFININVADYIFDLFITSPTGRVDKAGCGILPIVLCND